ncbi:glycosyltransferase [Acinetobacter towneri]|uniref:glycosyltransferase n=1 Tax=Acinetobacter towneri TaxID=202956 RepID=UPI001AA085ED|nr:glycosyltransferase [Acinetobacter towneri]QTD64835.1 glycosyltransferase [Acinetobacter towneri]
MKVTLVMAGDEEGGLEKHVVELVNCLMKHHQVTVVAHEKYRSRLKTEFIAIDLSKSRRNIIVLFQLYRALKALQSDIVHVHGNKAAAMVGSILKFLPTKSVATLHSRKKNTKMFKGFDAVIAVSPNAAETLEHPNKYIILNGIEPPELNSDINKITPPVVLAVGRLVPVKGFDLLIQAWQDIPNAQLWIVGEGFEKQKLATLINELALEKSIKLLGFRNDITDLMQQASLYVMSSHYEGCPYTMIEALLCKTPMVSTAVGAMAQILPKQYLCAENDANALHHLIAYALENLKQVERDFIPVFADAEKNLVLDGMVNNIEMVYREVLDGK